MKVWDGLKQGDGADVSSLPPPAVRKQQLIHTHTHTQLTPVESCLCVCVCVMKTHPSHVWPLGNRLNLGRESLPSLKIPLTLSAPAWVTCRKTGFCSLIRLSGRFRYGFLMFGKFRKVLRLWKSNSSDADERPLVSAFTSLCWDFHNCRLKVFVDFMNNCSLNWILSSLLFIFASLHSCGNISWCCPEG